MKIIIHTQYYPPETGAPQNRLSELAERLVPHGHEVIVITAMPNYPLGRLYPGYSGLFRREVRNGVTIIRTWIYPTKSVRLIPRLFNYFSFVLSSLVLGLLFLPCADYLMTESPPLFLGMSGYLLSRLKRAKWIFNVSDLWPESAVRLGVIGEGLSLRLSEKLEIFCYRKAWLITGQSKEILEGVKAKFPAARVYHLSNGVDSSVFRPELWSENIHEELAGGAECVAIYAGLHGIAQGLDQLVKAADMLSDLAGKLKIVLIGDGPEKEELVRSAEGMALLRLLPSRPKEELPTILASADIALVPLKIYLPGAVPSKIYEAMSSGLPVVLVAEGEAKAIIGKAAAGICVSPGKVVDLAAALRRLVQDSELRETFGKNGRNAVMGKYDRKIIVEGFTRMLEEKIHADL